MLRIYLPENSALSFRGDDGLRPLHRSSAARVAFRCKLVRMRAVLVMVVILVSACAFPAQARAEWTWADTAWEAAFAAAVVLDVGNTKHALSRGWEEGNPLLGKHPTASQLNTLVVAVPLAHAAISAILPEGNWRRGWQTVTFGVEAHAVYRSYTMGLRFRF